MDKKKNYLRLKRYALSHEADLFGVAAVNDIRKDFMLSASLRDRVTAALVIGVGLSRTVLSEIEQEPTRLYFHHYRMANMFLDRLAFGLARLIERAGFSAAAIPASQIVDWQKQSAHLSHKQLGVRAGLGWIGRNNLLVNPRFGAQCRYVTVLTDMPLVTDKPLALDCGSCHRCVIRCPARAIKEKAGDFDHLLCFEKLKEFQKKRLVDQYICGVCVNVCFGPTPGLKRRSKKGPDHLPRPFWESLSPMIF